MRPEFNSRPNRSRGAGRGNYVNNPLSIAVAAVPEASSFTLATLATAALLASPDAKKTPGHPALLVSAPHNLRNPLAAIGVRYARNAEVSLPSLEEYERGREDKIQNFRA